MLSHSSRISEKKLFHVNLAGMQWVWYILSLVYLVRVKNATLVYIWLINSCKRCVFQKTYLVIITPYSHTVSSLFKGTPYIVLPIDEYNGIHRHTKHYHITLWNIKIHSTFLISFKQWVNTILHLYAWLYCQNINHCACGRVRTIASQSMQYDFTF